MKLDQKFKKCVVTNAKCSRYFKQHGIKNRTLILCSREVSGKHGKHRFTGCISASSHLNVRAVQGGMGSFGRWGVPPCGHSPQNRLKSPIMNSGHSICSTNICLLTGGNAIECWMV